MHSAFIMSVSVPFHFVISLHAISKTNPIQASINYLFTICVMLSTLASYTLYSLESKKKIIYFFENLFKFKIHSLAKCMYTFITFLNISNARKVMLSSRNLPLRGIQQSITCLSIYSLNIYRKHSRYLLRILGILQPLHSVMNISLTAQQ